MKTSLRILSLFSLLPFYINVIYAQTNFWEEVNNGLYGERVGSLIINKSGHVFAGTNDFGVFRSKDNGDNWSHLDK